MRILFNNIFTEHNKDSKYDGGYRVEKFVNKYPDTEIDFDPLPYIKNVHNEEYIIKFKHECDSHGWMAEVDLTPVSYECALLAVGLTIKASDEGDFAVVRPSGHHANANFGAGFCFFNNIAITAKKLIGEGKRVALLDIDGHRGDGTQNILKDENEILCVSIHQQDVYGGEGEKFSDTNAINLTVPKGTQENDYLMVLMKAIGFINEFEPDIVGVSAGFDTYKEDKLLDIQLEIETYEKISNLLKQNFPNLFAHLAGGYHDKVYECVESFVKGYNGK